jgi:hypothetical protein
MEDHPFSAVYDLIQYIHSYPPYLEAAASIHNWISQLLFYFKSCCSFKINGVQIMYVSLSWRFYYTSRFIVNVWGMMSHLLSHYAFQRKWFFLLLSVYVAFRPSSHFSVSNYKMCVCVRARARARVCVCVVLQVGDRTRGWQLLGVKYNLLQNVTQGVSATLVNTVMNLGVP